MDRSKDMQTAHEEQLERAYDKLDAIRAKLDRAGQIERPHYGHVGDITHINELLDRILESLN